MKRFFLLFPAITLFYIRVNSQIIQNSTIYNLVPFAKSCCKDLRIDSCLIMIKGDDLIFRYQLRGQTSEIDKGNSYYIVMEKSLTFDETLFVLAHELVHIKQMKSRELRFRHDSIFYRDIAYPNSIRNHKRDEHELKATHQGILLYEKYRNVLILYD